MKHPLQLAIEASGEFTCRSYSGRGMYGRSCLGIAIDHNLGDLMADIIAAAGEDSDHADLIADAVRDLRTDSLGLGEIVYFPSVPFIEESDEDEDPSEYEPCEACEAKQGEECLPGCVMSPLDN